MPAGLLPSIIRIGSVLGPILLRAARPHIKRGVEFAASEIAGGVVSKFIKSRSKGKTFIMRRGNQRFQCRKVNK